MSKVVWTDGDVNQGRGYFQLNYLILVPQHCQTMVKIIYLKSKRAVLQTDNDVV